MLINGETYVPWDDFKTQFVLANRYRDALEKIIDLSDIEMSDGDGARAEARRALGKT